MLSTAMGANVRVPYTDSVSFGKENIEIDNVQLVDLLHDLGVILSILLQRVDVRERGGSQ